MFEISVDEMYVNADTSLEHHGRVALYLLLMEISFGAFSFLGMGLFFDIWLLPKNESLVCFRREGGGK